MSVSTHLSHQRACMEPSCSCTQPSTRLVYAARVDRSGVPARDESSHSQFCLLLLLLSSCLVNAQPSTPLLQDLMYNRTSNTTLLAAHVQPNLQPPSPTKHQVETHLSPDVADRRRWFQVQKVLCHKLTTSPGATSAQLSPAAPAAKLPTHFA